MSSEKKRNILAYSDSDTDFQQSFLSTLQAVSTPSSRKTATVNMKDFLKYNVDSSTRLNLVLSLISNILVSPQKGYSKPDVLQTLGTLSEVFREKLLDSIPNIFQIVLTGLTADNPDLNEPLRDAVGKVTKYTLNTLESKEGSKQLKNVLKSLWRISRGASTYTQIGAAMCISKILRVAKGEILRDHVERVASKIVRLLRKPECKARLQLMECVMSLVLSVDDNSGQLAKIAKAVLPVVIENIVNSESNVKKVSLEVLAFLVAMVGETIAPYKDLLIDNIRRCKHDKAKEVQDEAVKVLNLLKDLKDVSQEKTFSSQKNVFEPHSRSAQKERPVEKEKYEQHSFKEMERKKPGILKDSSYNNSPLVITPDEPISSQFLKNSKDKTVLGLNTTKNQRNLQSEPSIVKFYSPNGIAENQINHSFPNKEVSTFDARYMESNYARKLETTGYPNERENKSNTPTLNEERSAITPLSKSNTDFFKQRKPELSSDDMSTRQFTGEGDRDGSKKSNASSPAQLEFSQANLTEIYAQLSSINKSQETLLQGIDRLRTSTEDEIGFLKTRLTQLEGLVGKLFLQQKDPNLSIHASTIFSDYNSFKPNYLKSSYAILPGQLAGNEREPERLTSPNVSKYEEFLEKGKMKGREEEIEGRRTQERWRESDNKNLGSTKDVKGKKPLLWARIEEFLKKKDLTGAYELCLNEGDQELLLNLMRQTGPIVEKLKGNYGEIILNKLKSKLFDEDVRPILLDWIERALLTRVSIARGTLVALQQILGQVQEASRGSQRVHKIFECISALLEKFEDPEREGPEPLERRKRL